MGTRSLLRLHHFLAVLLTVLSFIPSVQGKDFFNTAPDWSFGQACIALFMGVKQPTLVPSAVGLPDIELLGLSRFAYSHESYVVILKPTLGSLRFHSETAGIAKPMKILLGKTSTSEGSFHSFPFKSARRGRLEGMVVAPSARHFRAGPELKNAQKIWEAHWPIYEKHGFTVDSNGAVRDPDDHFYFSDYDLLIVLDRNGIRRSFGSDGDQNPKVKNLLKPLNEAVGTELFRHDGYYEKEYFDEMVSTAQPTIIISPEGDAWTRPANEVPKLIEHLRSKIAPPIATPN